MIYRVRSLIPQKVMVEYVVLRRHVGKTRGRWEDSVRRDALRFAPDTNQKTAARNSEVGKSS